ncbi:MAG TPA: TraB/GumN family protein [Fulvivirga sp.]|nr:TraB/GumN family protein [Fulvivirga sp.]
MKIVKLVVITLMAINISQAQIKEKSLLWEVSGNEMESPSYIFAILKFIPGDDYYFPALAKTKFAECEKLSIETHLDHHARHELNKAAHLDNHESIEKYLTPEEYNKLKSIFNEQLSIPEYKFNLVYKKFKPVMLSTTMTRLTLGDNIRFYENELISMAKELGLDIVALETIEQEVEALEKLPLDVQVKALKHTIANFEAQLSDYKKLVAAYKLGDLHQALEYTLHPMENDEGFKQHFIFDRNKEWLNKMTEQMHESATFFALGASHLSESQGLLKMLTDKGYTVKPMK